IARAESRDAIDVEFRERRAEVRSLPEDRQPAQAGLESLEADLLEQSPIVGHRPAPLLIVIRDVERITGRPPATGETVGMVNETRQEAHGYWCRTWWTK